MGRRRKSGKTRLVNELKEFIKAREQSGGEVGREGRREERREVVIEGREVEVVDGSNVVMDDMNVIMDAMDVIMDGMGCVLRMRDREGGK